jgi:inhibitor of KinA sporulation pathway (predicted exonuclease)
MVREQEDILQSLVKRIRQLRKEFGDRLGDVLTEAAVRERAAAVSDKIEDLRLELAKRRPRGRPAAKPVKDMTVRELHQLAAKRDIAGRSSMNKAELIDALRKQ